MFKSELDLEEIPDRPDYWLITKPLVWVSRGQRITVPAGFVTDLASIPRLFRNLPLLDPDGLSRRPAALHDYLYGGDRSRGKAFADLTLREALRVEGISALGAQVYYLAVHWFGWRSWRSDGAKYPEFLG